MNTQTLSKVILFWVGGGACNFNLLPSLISIELMNKVFSMICWRVLYFVLELEQEFQSAAEEAVRIPYFLPTHTGTPTHSMPLPSTMRHTCSSSKLYISITCMDVHSINCDHHITHCRKEDVCREKQSIYTMW